MKYKSIGVGIITLVVLTNLLMLIMINVFYKNPSPLLYKELNTACKTISFFISIAIIILLW